MVPARWRSANLCSQIVLVSDHRGYNAIRQVFISFPGEGQNKKRKLKDSLDGYDRASFDVVREQRSNVGKLQVPEHRAGAHARAPSRQFERRGPLDRSIRSLREVHQVFRDLSYRSRDVVVERQFRALLRQVAEKQRKSEGIKSLSTEIRRPRAYIFRVRSPLFDRCWESLCPKSWTVAPVAKNTP